MYPYTMIVFLTLWRPCFPSGVHPPPSDLASPSEWGAYRRTGMKQAREDFDRFLRGMSDDRRRESECSHSAAEPVLDRYYIRSSDHDSALYCYTCNQTETKCLEVEVTAGNVVNVWKALQDAGLQPPAQYSTEGMDAEELTRLRDTLLGELNDSDECVHCTTGLYYSEDTILTKKENGVTYWSFDAVCQCGGLAAVRTGLEFAETSSGTNFVGVIRPNPSTHSDSSAEEFAAVNSTAPLSSVSSLFLCICLLLHSRD